MPKMLLASVRRTIVVVVALAFAMSALSFGPSLAAAAATVTVDEWSPEELGSAGTAVGLSLVNGPVTLTVPGAAHMGVQLYATRTEVCAVSQDRELWYLPLAAPTSATAVESVVVGGAATLVVVRVDASTVRLVVLATRTGARIAPETSLRAERVLVATSAIAADDDNTDAAWSGLGAVAFVAASGSTTAAPGVNLTEVTAWHFSTKWPNHWTSATFSRPDADFTPLWTEVRCGGVVVAFRETVRVNVSTTELLPVPKLSLLTLQPSTVSAVVAPTWALSTLGLSDEAAATFGLRSQDRCVGNAPTTCLVTVVADFVREPQRRVLRRSAMLLNIATGRMVDERALSWPDEAIVARNQSFAAVGERVPHVCVATTAPVTTALPSDGTGVTAYFEPTISDVVVVADVRSQRLELFPATAVADFVDARFPVDAVSQRRVSPPVFPPTAAGAELRRQSRLPGTSVVLLLVSATTGNSDDAVTTNRRCAAPTVLVLRTGGGGGGGSTTHAAVAQQPTSQLDESSDICALRWMPAAATVYIAITARGPGGSPFFAAVAVDTIGGQLVPLSLDTAALPLVQDLGAVAIPYHANQPTWFMANATHGHVVALAAGMNATSTAWIVSAPARLPPAPPATKRALQTITAPGALETCAAAVSVGDANATFLRARPTVAVLQDGRLLSAASTLLAPWTVIEGAFAPLTVVGSPTAEATFTGTISVNRSSGGGTGLERFAILVSQSDEVATPADSMLLQRRQLHVFAVSDPSPSSSPRCGDRTHRSTLFGQALGASGGGEWPVLVPAGPSALLVVMPGTPWCWIAAVAGSAVVFNGTLPTTAAPATLFGGDVAAAASMLRQLRGNRDAVDPTCRVSQRSHDAAAVATLVTTEHVGARSNSNAAVVATTSFVLVRPPPSSPGNASSTTAWTTPSWVSVLEVPGSIVAVFDHGDVSNTTIYVLQRAATASNIASVALVSFDRVSARVAVLQRGVPGVCATARCIQRLRTTTYAGDTSSSGSSSESPSEEDGLILVHLDNGYVFGTTNEPTPASVVVVALARDGGGNVTATTSVFTAVAGPVTVLRPNDRTVAQREVFLGRLRSGDGPVVAVAAVHPATSQLIAHDVDGAGTPDFQEAQLLEYANGRNGVAVLRLWRRPPAFSTLPVAARFERLLFADFAASNPNGRWIETFGALRSASAMRSGSTVVLVSSFANESASNVISVRFNDTRTTVAPGVIPGLPTAPQVFDDAVGNLGEGIAFSTTYIGSDGRPRTQPLGFSATRQRLLALGATNVAAANLICGTPTAIRVAAGTLVAAFEQASTGCAAVAVFGEATGWNATKGVGTVTMLLASSVAIVVSISGTTLPADKNTGHLLVVRGGGIAFVTTCVGVRTPLTQHLEAVNVAPSLGGQLGLVGVVGESRTHLLALKWPTLELSASSLLTLPGRPWPSSATSVLRVHSVDAGSLVAVTTQSASAAVAESGVAVFVASRLQWSVVTLYGLAPTVASLDTTTTSTTAAGDGPAAVVTVPPPATAARLRMWCTAASDNSSCAVLDDSRGAFTPIPGALTSHTALVSASRVVFFTTALRFTYAVIVDVPTTALARVAVVATTRVLEGRLEATTLAGTTTPTHVVAVGRASTSGECLMATLTLSSGIASNALAVAGPGARCVATVVYPLVAIRAVPMAIGAEQQPTSIAGITGGGTTLSPLYAATLTVKNADVLSPIVNGMTPLGAVVNSTFLVASVSWLDPGRSRVVLMHRGDPLSTSPADREPSLLAERVISCQPQSLQLTLFTNEDRLVLACRDSVRATSVNGFDRSFSGILSYDWGFDGQLVLAQDPAAVQADTVNDLGRQIGGLFGVTLARTTLPAGTAVIRVMLYDPLPGNGFVQVREIAMRGICRSWSRGVAGLFMGEADRGMYVGGAVTSAPFAPGPTSPAAQATEIATATISEVGYINGTCGTPLMADPTQLRGGSVALFTRLPDPSVVGTIVNVAIATYVSAADKEAERTSGSTHFDAAEWTLGPRWSEATVDGVVERCMPAGNAHQATLVTRANPGIATTLRVLRFDASSTSSAAASSSEQLQPGEELATIVDELVNETDVTSVQYFEHPAVSALSVVMRRAVAGSVEGETVVLVIDTNFVSVRARVVLPGSLFYVGVPSFDPTTVVFVSSLEVPQTNTVTRRFTISSVDAARAATAATVQLTGVATTAFASNPEVREASAADAPDDEALFLLFGGATGATYVAYTRTEPERRDGTAGRFDVASSSPPHHRPTRRIVPFTATTTASAAARMATFTTTTATALFLGRKSPSSSSSSPWLVLEGTPYAFSIPLASPHLLVVAAQPTDQLAMVSVVDGRQRALVATRMEPGELHRGRGMIDTEARTDVAWVSGGHAAWLAVPTYVDGTPPRAATFMVNVTADATTNNAAAIRFTATDGNRLHFEDAADRAAVVVSWWVLSYTVSLFNAAAATNPSESDAFTVANRQFVALLPSPADALTDDVAKRQRTFVVQQKFGSNFFAVATQQGRMRPVAAPSTAATSVEVIDRPSGSLLTFVGSRATEFLVFDPTETQQWAAFNGTVLHTMRTIATTTTAASGRQQQAFLVVLSRREVGLTGAQLAAAASHLTVFDAATGRLVARLDDAWRAASVATQPIPTNAADSTNDDRFVLLVGRPAQPSEPGLYALLDTFTGTLDNVTRVFNGAALSPFLDRVGEFSVVPSSSAQAPNAAVVATQVAARGLGDVTGRIVATRAVAPGTSFLWVPSNSTGEVRLVAVRRRHRSGVDDEVAWFPMPVGTFLPPRASPQLATEPNTVASVAQCANLTYVDGVRWGSAPSTNRVPVCVMAYVGVDPATEQSALVVAVFFNDSEWTSSVIVTDNGDDESGEPVLRVITRALGTEVIAMLVSFGTLHVVVGHRVVPVRGSLRAVLTTIPVRGTYLRLAPTLAASAPVSACTTAAEPCLEGLLLFEDDRTNTTTALRLFANGHVSDAGGTLRGGLDGLQLLGGDVTSPSSSSVALVSSQSITTIPLAYPASVSALANQHTASLDRNCDAAAASTSTRVATLAAAIGSDRDTRFFFFACRQKQSQQQQERRRHVAIVSPLDGRVYDAAIIDAADGGHTVEHFAATHALFLAVGIDQVADVAVFAPHNASHATFTVERVGGLSDWRLLARPAGDSGGEIPSVAVLARLPVASDGGGIGRWRLLVADVVSRRFFGATIAAWVSNDEGTVTALHRAHPPVFDAVELSVPLISAAGIRVVVGAKTEAATFVFAIDIATSVVLSTTSLEDDEDDSVIELSEETLLFTVPGIVRSVTPVAATGAASGVVAIVTEGPGVAETHVALCTVVNNTGDGAVRRRAMALACDVAVLPRVAHGPVARLAFSNGAAIIAASGANETHTTTAAWYVDAAIPGRLPQTKRLVDADTGDDVVAVGDANAALVVEGASREAVRTASPAHILLLTWAATVQRSSSASGSGEQWMLAVAVNPSGIHAAPSALQPFSARATATSIDAIGISVATAQPLVLSTTSQVPDGGAWSTVPTVDGPAAFCDTSADGTTSVSSSVVTAVCQNETHFVLAAGTADGGRGRWTSSSVYDRRTDAVADTARCGGRGFFAVLSGPGGATIVSVAPLEGSTTMVGFATAAVGTMEAAGFAAAPATATAVLAFTRSASAPANSELHVTTVSCTDGARVSAAAHEVDVAAPIASLTRSLPGELDGIVAVGLKDGGAVLWSTHTGESAGSLAVATDRATSTVSAVLWDGLAFVEGFAGVHRHVALQLQSALVVAWRGQRTRTPTVPAPSRTAHVPPPPPTRTATAELSRPHRTATLSIRGIARRLSITLTPTLSHTRPVPRNATRTAFVPRVRTETPLRERTFVKPAPRDIAFLPDAAAEDAVAITALVVAGASALGTPSAVLYGSRVVQLLQLGRCRDPLVEDGAALGFADSPVAPLALGSGPLAGHLGGAVIPGLIVLAAATVHYVIGVVFGRALGLRTVADALAMVRHPSGGLPLLLFAFPFAVMNAATITAHGDAPIRVQGVIVLVLALAVIVYVSTVVLSDSLPRLCVWIAPPRITTKHDDDDDERQRYHCVDRFVTQGRWYSRPRQTFLPRFGYLFREARPGRTFAVAIDLIVAAACSVIAGLRPVDDPEACDALAYTYAALAVIHTILHIWLAPFSGVATTLLLFGASLALACASVFAAMAVGGGPAWSADGVGWSVVVSVGFLGMKALLDLVVALSDLVRAPPQLADLERRRAGGGGRRSPSPPRPEARPLKTPGRPGSPSPARYHHASDSAESRDAGGDDGGAPLLSLPQLGQWAGGGVPFSRDFSRRYGGGGMAAHRHDDYDDEAGREEDTLAWHALMHAAGPSGTQQHDQHGIGPDGADSLSGGFGGASRFALDNPLLGVGRSAYGAEGDQHSAGNSANGQAYYLP